MSRGTPAVIFWCVLLLLLGDALDAYSLGGIPIQWIVRAGVIMLATWAAAARRLYIVPGMSLLALLFVWSGIVTSVNVLIGGYDELVPLLGTSSYPLFIFLRLSAVLAFIATASLVYWLAANGYRGEMIKAIGYLGVAVSLVALYVYLAQVFGLPELARTRVGTGGGEQVLRFTYPFQRAMGTFREPSFLGEWLVVPFFMSLGANGKIALLLSATIGGAILLTGSLTGFLGVGLGFVFAFFSTRPIRKAHLRTLLVLLLAVTFSALAFSWIAVGQNVQDFSLWQTVTGRIQPILVSGPQASNRGYVYEFMAQSPIPVFGVGVGHANLTLTHYLGSDAVASFLSLYMNYLYSTGIVGAAMLATFLAWPLRKLVAARGQAYSLTIVAAYVSYLVMFAVRAEELTAMFGVAFALFVHSNRAVAQARRNPGSSRALQV